MMFLSGVFYHLKREESSPNWDFPNHMSGFVLPNVRESQDVPLGQNELAPVCCYIS